MNQAQPNTNMTEENKLEDFSGHPPLHTDPQVSIDIPDSGAVDSTIAPTGYQTLPSSKIDVGEEKRLGFFGYGFGWDLFILGLFLLGIPWFVGAVIFLIMICLKADMSDKYGYAACFLGAMVISIILDSFQKDTCTQCLSEGVNFS